MNDSAFPKMSLTLNENDEDFKRVKEYNSIESSPAGAANPQTEDGKMEDKSFMGSLWLVCKRSTPTILTMIFFQMV